MDILAVVDEAETPVLTRRKIPQLFASAQSNARRLEVPAPAQDHYRIRRLAGKSTSKSYCTMVDTSVKDVCMPGRRRSRSEGATKAAQTLQASLLLQSPPTPLPEDRTISFPRCAELYVRTSDGVVFQDEDFQRQTIAKAERLVETALSPESSERNALIAKKALKYREMRSRRPTGEADLRIPELAFRTQSCPAPIDRP
ncbi:hypothetical protein PR003_g18722 [Phytophthora rubi]|uniref:Uncharacterized protein n=1 Tax=Phytophthora rubi TaxID=129364 RepID=A0A6A3H8R5_9STRA|nr:hypothetical protein PR002_g29407 [Phytophthora rubi]KAE8965542.1 hypothetical protein PR001_g28696 [Phytophthora rubi]KAE9316428.1 hypothetical protein PR003_g18722 [Phytophthora rubi]